MVFSSMIFLWVFLPTVFLIYKAVGLTKADWTLKAQNVWLLISSLVFYAWGEPKFVFLMLSSIVVNYLAGIMLGKASGSVRKAVLAAAIILNLSALGYFKYLSTSIALLQKVVGFDIVSLANIALPIGLSFYTFQAISYVVDVYRGTTAPQKDILTLALYITLFPQLVAGPIVKYKDVEDQLNNRVSSSSKTFEGIRRFAWGLGKKVLIANQVAIAVDAIFALPTADLSTPLAWIGAVLYALQIYFDFSGYSDMAIGLGLMFGFRFMENFNLPYLSRSIREFWRRWHISLSTWFREYLYIPLGGNRKGKFRTYLNLLAVFFATGIWHGAGLSFIAWGMFHGFFMVVERLGFGRILDHPKAETPSRIYTLLVVLVGWVLFRADSLTLAMQYLHAMFIPTLSSSFSVLEIVSVKTILIAIIGIALAGPIQALFAKLSNSKTKDFLAPTSEERSTSTIVAALQSILLLCIVAICITQLIANSYNPFIYFRF